MPREYLQVTGGDATGQRFLVDREVVFGRWASDERNLGGDPEISREHARIARADNGELQIEDLGSTNGTFVNGERISAPRALKPTDVVHLGGATLEVMPAEREYVRVIEGNAAGTDLALGDELVIGRAESGEGGLGGDPEISRRHARMFHAGGQLKIEDLGSTNGTYVGGRRIDEPETLKPGDIVWVGHTKLEVLAAGAGTEGPASDLIGAGDPTHIADASHAHDELPPPPSEATAEPPGVAAIPPRPSVAPSVRGKEPLIVVADDDEDLLRLLVNRLSKRGYHVLTAGDGDEALGVVYANAPDAVVVDWIMPSVQGHEVCAQLKANSTTARIPVVMLTARTSEPSVQTAFEYGADEYLTKPFEIQELDALLSRLIPDRS